MTQVQLASLLLKSIETVSNFERGKTLPGLLTVEKLAKVLGLETKQLFDFESEPPLIDTDIGIIRTSDLMSAMTEDERALIVDFAEMIIHRRGAL